MGMLAWVMMGLALWHFTIFLPDRFWGGIVGAFCGALIGSIVFGLIVNGFTVPGESRHASADRPGGDPRRADRHGGRLVRGHPPRGRRARDRAAPAHGVAAPFGRSFVAIWG